MLAISTILQLTLWWVYIFYSSRRRHTRWPRDWSSDVCSSDLSQRTLLEWALDALRPMNTDAGPIDRDAVWAEKKSALERSEEHTSELQSRGHLVCRLLLEKKKKTAATWFGTEIPE